MFGLRFTFDAALVMFAKKLEHPVMTLNWLEIPREEVDCVPAGIPSLNTSTIKPSSYRLL
jgi:hypothetical protein